jgi:hypothetical protein
MAQLVAESKLSSTKVKILEHVCFRVELYNPYTRARSPSSGIMREYYASRVGRFTKTRDVRIATGEVISCSSGANMPSASSWKRVQALYAEKTEWRHTGSVFGEVLQHFENLGNFIRREKTKGTDPLVISQKLAKFCESSPKAYVATCGN